MKLSIKKEEVEWKELTTQTHKVLFRTFTTQKYETHGAYRYNGVYATGVPYNAHIIVMDVHVVVVETTEKEIKELLVPHYWNVDPVYSALEILYERGKQREGSLSMYNKLLESCK